VITEGTIRVAVVVPCYDDGATLPDTIGSIEEPEPVELVVVDDGSRDPQTRDLLAQLERDGVRVVRHERNRGLPEARMTGVRATKAPYLFPLDSDDCAVPGVLSRMADALDRRPDAAVCYGDYLEFGRKDLVRAVPDSIDPYRIAYTNEYPAAALFRRDVLERLGGWNGELGLPSYEDWHLWMKLAEEGRAGVHLGRGQLTYRRRLHSDGPPRLLDLGKEQHVDLYRQLQAHHAELFGRLPEHRRASALSPPRKLLYPIVYGGRRRLRFERRVKRLLDRIGVWTLRR
jgi:glycosyltransferase involved in cell wall biosynthesis